MAEPHGEVNTEDGLRASEARLRQVMAVTGSGVWDWQIGSDRISHNLRWCELLGLGEAHLEHRLADFSRLIHDDDHAAVMARVQDCLAGAGPLCQRTPHVARRRQRALGRGPRRRRRA